MEKAANTDETWCMSEVIFCDLSPDEMVAIAAHAPMRTYAAGELIYTPHAPVEALLILKEGRDGVARPPDVRPFRRSA